MCWGAFTAGLKGGLIYNDSFPMMGKAWIPPEAHTSVISNPAGAQFLHRWLAISSLIMVCGLWAHAYARGKLSIAITLVGHRDIVWPGLDSVGRDASGGRGDVDDVVNYRGASGSRALSLIARRVFNPEKL